MELVLTKKDKEEIKESVLLAEKETTGEIVPMVVKSSDFYPAAHFRASIFFGLSFGFILYYFPFYEVNDALYYIWAIMIGMFIGHGLCFNNRLKRLFLSRKEISEEVHQKAIESFFYSGVHQTKERTGILLFISTLEHRAEIIADSGINTKVEKGAWDKILSQMLQGIKKGQSKEAIIQAIHACGELLTEHFPSQKDQINENELSNEIITEESL